MNLADDLGASAQRHPATRALIFQDSAVTYSELDKQLDSLAAGLYRLGVRAGDRVAFAVGNRPEFVVIHFGILRAGAVSVPLNPTLTTPELRRCLSSVTPRVIIADGSVVNEVMSAGPHTAPVFVIGEHLTARPFDQIFEDAPPPEVSIEAESLAVLAYTSGTAGAPKAAMLTHGNLAANLDQMLQITRARTEPDDIVLGVLPMFHLYALNVVLGLSFRQGATVLLQERFDPSSTMRAVVQDRVTILVGEPAMFIAWLETPGLRSTDLSHVRFAISGSSALSPDVIAAFRNDFGVEIWEGYGLTEASPALTTTRMAEQRMGSVGKPLAGVELRLVDEAGGDASLGDPGEIWVRGPNIFKGYWDEPHATASALSDGWLRTGDLAYRDEDGYLWLVDRLKELIIVSGFNVYPKEVEDVMRTHPAVADVAVVGVAHPLQGESVKAYVVARTDMSVGEEELMVHCTRSLSRFKVPAQIEFVADLPRLPTGKVLKRML